MKETLLELIGLFLAGIVCIIILTTILTAGNLIVLYTLDLIFKN